MDPQNPLNNPSPEAPLPDPSGMGIKPKKKGNPAALLGVVAAVILVVVVAVVFVLVSNSSKNKSNNQAQYDAGYKKGQSDQKATSEADFLAQQASDSRVYKAASEFGSFELPLPKSWSFATTPNLNNGTFVGIADPDYVDVEKDNHVFSFELKTGDYQKIITDYNNQSGKIGSDIKGSDVTVSGIKGRRYVGTFDTKNKIKSDIVVLPYREKVIVIKTDDPAKYTASFNTVLGGIKLVP